MGKIKSLSALITIVKENKKQGKTIVFTNGCFDIIHSGHIAVLKKAKSLADILIVGLNSDASVKRLKGKTRPINDEKSRAIVLSAIEFVDYVVIFSEDTPYKTLQAIRPDYLVKGGDWDIKSIIGSDLVKKVIRVNIVPGKSTTNIIKQIKHVG